ncbi:hypothetical protein [Trueperella abortisuis]|nr:hypothetical protein [Trueperella abortisuis]
MVVIPVGFDKLTTAFADQVFPYLSKPMQSVIESDRASVDIAMEIDDFLQFSLLDGVEIPTDLLDVTEVTIRAGWDPELTERSLGWIAKHRARVGT